MTATSKYDPSLKAEYGRSLDQYAAVPKKFFGFDNPVEERSSSIHVGSDLDFELRDRLKLPLLSNGLTAPAVDSAELTRLAVCAGLPRIENIPEALGCLYVLEGSTSGARSSPGI